MGDNTELARTTIKHILDALEHKVSHPYILVGGSSLILHGSRRATNDIDLLVPRDIPNGFLACLTAIIEETEQKWIEKADILFTLIGWLEFDEIKGFTTDIEGVKVPELDVMLGTKVLCHYRRPDGLTGDLKRASDLADIHWIAHTLKARGWQVRKEVIELLVCGPYNMVLVLESLWETFGKESVEVFESVGGREFESEWGKEEYAEQMDLYEMEIGEIFGEWLEVLQSRKKPK